MSSIHSLLGAIGLVSLAVAAGYALLALIAGLKNKNHNISRKEPSQKD